MKTVLVTGGCGYIGSHTCVKLIEKGFNVVIVDNLYNSKIDVLDKIEKLTSVKPIFYNVDINDYNSLSSVIKSHNFDACIHFAGLKAVGESCQKPLEYYSTNVSGSLNLYNLLIKYNVNNIIFSSSATVYGNDFKVPFKEEYGQGKCTNPYGNTKLINENILTDLCVSNSNVSSVMLRYFNPIGAHPSGLLGENPNGIPNNLIPYIAKVAVGELECINVFGNDYDTKDGTGVRDYIHVEDLARAHVLALEYSFNNIGSEVINIGTGIGYSVLEIIDAYSKTCGKKLDYKILPRRSGDIATCYADTSKAFKLLNFKTEYDLYQMCKDSYNFIVNNK